MADNERKMSREDMLRVENIYLKIENGKVQEELLRRSFAESMQKLMGDRKRLQEEMTTLKEEFTVKYEINLGVDQIRADGTIVPAGSAPAGSINPPLSS